MKKFLFIFFTLCLNWLSWVQPVQAATVPFNETAWYPGAVATRSVQIQNTSTQTSVAGLEVVNLVDPQGLSAVIDVEVKRGSSTGTTVLSGKTLQQLAQSGYVTFDTLSSGQASDYVVIATMRTGAVNSYQGASAQFTLNVGWEVTSASPTPSGSGTSSGGETTPAAPPVCTATTPTSAPTLRITTTGPNTVSLAWTGVSPVTHYALVFTRESDGAQYGSTNIGNVTSFTVSNLSGGARYSFQVFGVNDCAPGPRSNGVSSGNVQGGSTTGRPVGSGGQVLGTQTGSGRGSGGSSATGGPGTATAGAVLGATGSASASADLIATAAAIASPTDRRGFSLGLPFTFSPPCSQAWRFYLPALLLVLQLASMLAVEFKFRYTSSWLKHGLTLAIIFISVGVFYGLRDCSCFEPWLWLEWICTWYWLVAVVVGGLVRAFSYGFIEEVTELLHNE